MEGTIYIFIDAEIQRNLLCISLDPAVLGRQLKDLRPQMVVSLLLFFLFFAFVNENKICDADN